MRLIDADELMETLELDCHNNGEGMTSEEEWVAEAIMNAPTIEAEPVRRGRWNVKDDPHTSWYKVACSECGFGGVVTWDYCPQCGARMEDEG